MMTVTSCRLLPGDIWGMKATLIFPSYLHLSGFMAVATCGDIEMDLRTRSLTGSFSEAEIRSAVERFGASTSLAFH